jgi:DNA-binding Lrp family transcriptional regulator
MSSAQPTQEAPLRQGSQKIQLTFSHIIAQSTADGHSAGALPAILAGPIDAMPLVLDATDWRILKELQADGRMTNIALATKIGLSAPPCLRRVRALEEAGLISGYTALLAEEALGFPLTAFAMVRLHNQAEADLRTFENRILGWPLVREAHMLSGESDFMLKCIAQDLTGFQEFVLHELTAAPNVASVKTFLTIRRAKREPGIPINVAG